MATSKQEKTYNEIIEYYSYADKLILEVEDFHGELADEQFNIIEKLVENLEKCADKLTCNYIEYVKNGESEQIIEETRDSLNLILAKIQECRNKILQIYK